MWKCIPNSADSDRPTQKQAVSLAELTTQIELSPCCVFYGKFYYDIFSCCQFLFDQHSFMKLLQVGLHLRDDGFLQHGMDAHPIILQIELQYWREPLRHVPFSIYFACCRGAKYCDEHVCLFVCQSVCLCLFVCLSTCISQKRHVHTSQNFMFVLPGTVAHSWWQWDTLCTSGFVDNVMFSHNEPYGMWHWQYLREHCAGK